MKALSLVALALILSSGLFAQTTPAIDKKQDLKELHNDLRETKTDKKERVADVKNGDRQGVKAETKEIKADKKDVRNDVKVLKADGIKHPVRKIHHIHKMHH